MKVGINARAFSVEEPGGAVQAAMTLTKELATRPEIDPVLFGHRSTAEGFPTVPIDDDLYPYPSQVYGLLWERTVLPRLARRHDLDVLYCPNGNGPLHEISCPVVMCIHDVNAQRGLSGSIHRSYRALTVPRAAAAADAVVTVSAFSKRELLDTLDVPPSAIHIVHNGVDPLFLDSSEGTPLAIDLPDRYVLYVGAMNPRKNVERLVAAFKHTKNRLDLPHDLVLVGPKNKGIFKRLDVTATDGVVLPGFVSETELKYAYANAEAFVYPSLYEGFGLPPLEAMACGTPVVTSNASSLPEVVGDAAELVDPTSVAAISEGIERVLTDDAYRNTLVQRGEQRAATFSWERAGERALSVLRSVASSTPVRVSQ